MAKANSMTQAQFKAFYSRLNKKKVEPKKLSKAGKLKRNIRRKIEELEDELLIESMFDF